MDDCLQLLLLAKAVTVALLADEIVLPGQQGQCGLLAIYLTICCSIIGLAVQYYSAESLLSGKCSVASHVLQYIIPLCVCRHRLEPQTCNMLPMNCRLARVLQSRKYRIVGPFTWQTRQPQCCFIQQRCRQTQCKTVQEAGDRNCESSAEHERS